jgi:DNA-binding MurR/RpiR family transcriptional regulator
MTREYQSLSPSFKKIADFILTSHQRAAFMSGSQMGRHLDVDVATVTRFAQHIGYDGYVELIREIRETTLQEMREVRATVTDRLEAAEGRFDRTLWRDWANLEKTIQNVRLEDAEEAIEALQSARRVYIVSEGVGAGLAQVVASYLSMSKAEVVVLKEGVFDMALALKGMGPEDVVVGVGFTNYAHAATRTLEFARKVGAKTIGVMSQPDCPISTQADLLFSCSATEEGYLASPTGVSAILFALVYSALMGDRDKYRRDLLHFQETYADLSRGGRDKDDMENLVGRFLEQSE